MGRVGVAVVHALMGVTDELDEEEEMVGMSVVGAHVVDWTDARRLVVPDAGPHASWDEMGRKEVKAVNTDVHLDLAVDILEKILGPACPKQEKKTLTSMLAKLSVTPTSTPSKLHAVHDLLNAAVDARIATDAPSRNALNKLLAALTKAIRANVSASTGNAASLGNGGAGKTSSLSSSVAVKGGDGNHEDGTGGGGDGDETVGEEGVATTAVEEEEEGEKMEGVQEGKDSVLEELLDEGGEGL